MRVVRRKRQRANLNFAGFGMEGEIHLAAPPMVAAVRTKPHAGAHCANTDRELLSHGSHHSPRPARSPSLRGRLLLVELERQLGDPGRNIETVLAFDRDWLQRNRLLESADQGIG